MAGEGGGCERKRTGCFRMALAIVTIHLRRTGLGKGSLLAEIFLLSFTTDFTFVLSFMPSFQENLTLVCGNFGPPDKLYPAVLQKFSNFVSRVIIVF